MPPCHTKLPDFVKFSEHDGGGLKSVVSANFAFGEGVVLVGGGFDADMSRVSDVVSSAGGESQQYWLTLTLELGPRLALDVG